MVKLTYYNYAQQCWYEDGVAKRCYHPEEMDCACYGKTHEGEKDPYFQKCEFKFNKRLFI